MITNIRAKMTRAIRAALKKGDLITFKYELQSNKGELTAVLVDPAGQTVIEFEPRTKGEETALILASGRHFLKIRGEKARGNYSFEWSNNEN